METEAEKYFVQQCGIDICQGFYFAKPMPLDNALAWTKTAALKDEKMLRNKAVFQSRFHLLNADYTL